jgi:outer membrane receptor for ferrienterochelin and colicins
MPSLNTKIKLNDRQDIRLSYGRGFRAPSIRELYFNFFDASHSIEGNPNLKPETSNSFAASWNWIMVDNEAGKFTAVLGGFYNEMKDRIDYGVKAGSTVTTLINLDRYKTQGVTWTNAWKNRNWDANVGFGYTGRYNEISNDFGNASYQWSPEITTNASYKTKRGGWNFTAYYKYTGRLPYPEIATVNGQSVLNIAKMNSYNWADLSVQKTLFKRLTATLGSHNVLNVKNVGGTSLVSGGAHSTGPVRPIGSGRGYYLSLVYTFNQ